MVVAFHSRRGGCNRLVRARAFRTPRLSCRVAVGSSTVDSRTDMRKSTYHPRRPQPNIKTTATTTVTLATLATTSSATHLVSVLPDSETFRQHQAQQAEVSSLGNAPPLHQTSVTPAVPASFQASRAAPPEETFYPPRERQPRASLIICTDVRPGCCTHGTKVALTIAVVQTILGFGGSPPEREPRHPGRELRQMPVANELEREG